jgi:hypothetical protein
LYLCSALTEKVLCKKSFGEVAEWSIATVLKTAVLQGTRGSNPCLSAINVDYQRIVKFTPIYTPKRYRWVFFLCTLLE